MLYSKKGNKFIQHFFHWLINQKLHLKFKPVPCKCKSKVQVVWSAADLDNETFKVPNMESIFPNMESRFC